MQEIRAANPDLEITIDAAIGPRGDGYVVGEAMTAERPRPTTPSRSPR